MISLKQVHTGLLSDNQLSEILRGSAWALLARVIATGLGLVTSVIIARFYGAEAMGIVAMLNSFLLLATIFTVFGTDTSILRLIPEHLAKYSPTSAFKVYRKTQYFVAVVSVITGAIFFMISDFIAGTVFAKPHLGYYFALTAFFIFFESIAKLNTQAVRGIRLIQMFAFMQILPSLSKLIILASFTVFFFHPDNPAYAMFASIVITALAGVYIMDCLFKRKTSPHDDTQSMPMKNILSISLPMLMNAGMLYFLKEVGIIMLGVYRPDAEVGYFSVAIKLAMLAAFALQAINSISTPKFSELFHTGKMDELFYVAKESAKLIFWTTWPIFAFLILMGKPILSLLYGQDFVAAYGAMVILLVGQFINAICGSNGGFMNMTGHQKILGNIIAGSAFICLILNFLLIPGFGIHGAAFSAMIGTVFMNFSVLFYMKRKFGRTTAYIPLLTRRM